MAIRNWSVGRLAIIWLAWIALLVAAFALLLVNSPEGIQVSLSPPTLTGLQRWAALILAFAIVFAPPLVVTYIWYLGRLRSWSEGTPRSKPREPAA
jgi:zinc transporter ZupT